MKSLSFLLILTSLILVSCNDVSSNRSVNTEPKPEANAESESKQNLRSGIIRNLGSSPLTYTSEIARNGRASAEYRLVPDVTYDDEGLVGKNVYTRSYLKRPSEECGLALKQTLKERIANCKKMNGKRAIWEGIKNASATEGNWSLVALDVHTASVTKEIWLDERTGMLWSDIVTSTNWCEASGNDQPFEQGAFNVDCSDLMKKSICYGQDLLKLSGITWRLPTRNDFLQADLDGLRFVMKKGDEQGFWTATMNSTSVLREQAWVYHQDKSGTLAAEGLATSKQVRCIGVSK